MLCCVFWLVSPKCLGGKCLGSKFLHRVNASAPASTWMVRYAISSTPFWWHVWCDCSASLFCSVWLFRLAFRNYVALAPFVVWFASTLCDDAVAMIGSMIWCFRVEFLFLLSVWVWCFVFVWSSRSLLSWLWWLRACFFIVAVCLGNSLRGWVHLCLVLLFVVFWFVFVFVFARSRSQIDEWVIWLPKPILVLLEGGAAWGWRFSGVALLEGGAALGWRCSGVALFVYMDRRSTEYCWSLLDIDTTQRWLIGF